MYHNIIAIIKLSRATHCYLLRYHLFIISQKQQPNRKETWRLTGHMRNGEYEELPLSAVQPPNLYLSHLSHSPNYAQKIPNNLFLKTLIAC